MLTVGPNVDEPSRKRLTFRRILLITDLNLESSTAVLFAFSLAAEEDSRISICHVLPERIAKTMNAIGMQAKFTRTVHKLIPENIWNNCEAEYVVEYGNAADEVLKLAQEKHADLVVLGACSASAVATHLVPGIAFRVIAGSACPVLTIRG